MHFRTLFQARRTCCYTIQPEIVFKVSDMVEVTVDWIDMVFRRILKAKDHRKVLKLRTQYEGR